MFRPFPVASYVTSESAEVLDLLESGVREVVVGGKSHGYAELIPVHHAGMAAIDIAEPIGKFQDKRKRVP
jgi:hypothetical protein